MLLLSQWARLRLIDLRPTSLAPGGRDPSFANVVSHEQPVIRGAVAAVRRELSGHTGQANSHSDRAHMNIIKALVVLSLAAGAYAAWKHHHQHSTPRDAANLSIDAAGPFVSLPPVDGQRPQTVFVIAAQDCPHDDAQRADRLAESLSSRGIPVERTHSTNFRFTIQPDSDTVDRIAAFMNGPLPVVFINGRAKANPSLDEVASEFGRSSP